MQNLSMSTMSFTSPLAILSESTLTQVLPLFSLPFFWEIMTHLVQIIFNVCIRIVFFKSVWAWSHLYTACRCEVYMKWLIFELRLEIKWGMTIFIQHPVHTAIELGVTFPWNFEKVVSLFFVKTLLFKGSPDGRVTVI